MSPLWAKARAGKLCPTFTVSRVFVVTGLGMNWLLTWPGIFSFKRKVAAVEEKHHYGLEHCVWAAGKHW